ncbi:MAG: SpoIIE family protein phosphatase [bacterium]
MINILDTLIGDIADQDEEIQQLCTALKDYIPPSFFLLIADRHEGLSSKGELELPDEIRDHLVAEAKLENSMVWSQMPHKDVVYALPVPEFKAILIFILPEYHANLFARQQSPDSIQLCIRLFFLKKNLEEEQEYRIVQKNQLNRKIKSLEKSYMEILEDNSKQHQLIQKRQREYSKTLKIEIERQTEELRMINTRLEESSHLKQKILDNAATAIFTVDIYTNITSVNREFCMITGFSKDDIIGKKSALLGGDFGGPFVEGKILKKHGTLRTKTGQELIIIRNADMILDDSGRITGAVESFIDITSLIKAREAAEVARDDLAATCQALLKKQHDLDDDLKAASEIQRSLLPKSSLNFQCGEVEWRFIPCQRVGGDIFNIFELNDNCWGMYMLDVSGHGVPSAMVSVSVSQMLQPQTGSCLKKLKRSFPYYELVSPSEVLSILDKEYPFERFEKYFTMTYLLLDVRNGNLTYSNAAHPSPLLIHTDGTLEFLQEGGTIIGMDGILPFEEGRRQLQPGDKLFIYTDGIIEYQDRNGEFYGKERFHQEMDKLKNKPISHIIEGIMSSMMDFGKDSEPQDDISLLGVEFKQRKEQ